MSQFVTDRAYDYFDLGDESDQESAERWVTDSLRVRLKLEGLR